MLSPKRLTDEHDDMAARLAEVEALLAGPASRERKVEFCEESLHVLWRHMRGEEEYMAAIGYPAAKRERHGAHHGVIFERLSDELWRLMEGRSDGRAAIPLAHELMRVHREEFDRDLARYVLLHKYGRSPAPGG